MYICTYVWYHATAHNVTHSEKQYQIVKYHTTYYLLRDYLLVLCCYHHERKIYNTENSALMQQFAHYLHIVVQMCSSPAKPFERIKSIEYAKMYAKMSTS
jgi:hypothetical protein